MSTSSSPEPAARRSRTLWFVIAGLAITLLLAGVASYYASSSPDGLEKVAEDTGFIEDAQDSAVSGSALADYGVAGVENERLGVGIAGVIGVVITFAFAGGMFLLVRRKGAATGADDGADTTTPAAR